MVGPVPRRQSIQRPVLQDVRIFGLQHRAPNERRRRPWYVRWSIDGLEHARAFRTKVEAERFRLELLVAHRDGDRFDRESGCPESWLPRGDEVRVHDWARRWLAEQWPEWQPRTRSSAVEAIARFVPLATAKDAPPVPAGLRAHLVATLRPGVEATGECAEWLDRWCLSLAELSREVLAEVEGGLMVALNGSPLSPATAARYRKVARACIRRAVELEVVAVDPWPPSPRGRSRRKAVRVRRSVDVRRLPSPAAMARAMDAMVSHQPGSHMYRVMTAIAYYAGLRPSEVVMLRARALQLPATGWGRIEVVEADISFDEPGEPKTGPRSVPIPPLLVEMLIEWLRAGCFRQEDLLFRTRSGRRPTASNWVRCWQRALAAVGLPRLRVYDCRHAAATTWLKAGLPLGEVARRLGHSVETLVSTYVGALDGDEELGNRRIEAVLAESTLG
jgi:integrase